MIKWSDLEFPSRVIAIVVVVLTILILGFISRTYMYGEITVASSVPGAFVYTVSDSDPKALPQTYKVRPGKYTFVVEASGYKASEVQVPVTVFQKKRIDVPLEKVSFNLEDPASIPLYNDLPYETQRFRIDLPNSSGEYVITLFADLNNPDDYALYQQQLTAYGKEALAWITSKKVDPAKLSLVWFPEKPAEITVGVSEPGATILHKKAWWQFWR